MTDDACTTYFGKYRGKVENTIDPYGIGRVQVSVPDVYGEGTMAWAMPCLPGVGPNIGFFAVPPNQANVWVEFERGDPNYPVWTGGFWDQGDCPVPVGVANPTTRSWVGDNFNLEFNDTPGLVAAKLSVRTTAGEALVEIGAAELKVSFAGSSIKLATDGVSINGTNLKVLP